MKPTALAGAVIALGLASAALAQDSAWTPYRNDSFHVAFDFPVKPVEQLSSLDVSGAKVPTLMVSAALGERGALVAAAGDYGALPGGGSDDAVLDAAVQGALTNMAATQDSIAPITVAGVAGRDVTAHTATMRIRIRALYANRHIATAMGGGPASQPFIAEYERFAGSLRVWP